MNLLDHYDRLYLDSIKKIKVNEYEVDQLIDNPDDKRYGITLLIRPSSEIKQNIKYFLDKMREIDSYQYYYRKSDMHITVLSIISCYQGFSLSDIQISDYIKIINEAICEIGPFNISFKGITASTSCIMIQGFPENDMLSRLRSRIKRIFSKSALENSIDIRYELKTAHSTVIRLKKELFNKEEYLKKLELYRNYDFGIFKANNIELVYNDWYQKLENTKHLMSFELK